MDVRAIACLIIAVTAVVSTPFVSAPLAQSPDPGPPRLETAINYRLSFPDRAHRVMHVEVIFRDLPAGALQLRMSRTSPGRYALHEFAKNVFDVRVSDGNGRPLTVTRPNLHQWDVAGHGGEVRVNYRIYGDRVDGTYLSVDTSHAHINMPAAMMWARGMERRPIRVRFEPPAGSSWRVATQLLPAGDAFTYSAPNLAYLMDSPTELSAFALRTFTAGDGQRTPVFRVAVHHTGSDADVDALARGIEAIVREALHVFRQYPPFEGNTYTFIADYLPWASDDAMEHRNSTILTAARTIRDSRIDLLDTASHEFFHVWNVERIRPASLEPFNLEEASIPSELWLAEGFTNYYGPLIMRRAGLFTTVDFAQEMGRAVNTVLNSPGRQLRSPVEMSQFAAFVDAATAIDRTNFENTFISYYTWGEAIALGLDLALRERSSNRVTLDDFMRALWDRFGVSASKVPGLVERGYTMGDVRTVLGDVAGDPAFAADFVSRYIEGRDVVDYAHLLSTAGLVLRRAAPGRAFAGSFRLQDSSRGARVDSLVPIGSPAYDAGLEEEDVIVSLGGTRITVAGDVDRVLGTRKPGDRVPIIFERRGQPVTATVQLIEDPTVEVVPGEQAGQPPTDAQRRTRDAWLSSAARNTF